MVREKPPLWTCPKCNAKFVIRNLYHGCRNYSVETFLEGKGPRARRLFQTFADRVGRCGAYEVSPAKTRVSFMVRVRFAAVTRVSDRGMTVEFALPRRLDHPRIHRVERPVPRWYIHYLRVTSPQELDNEILGWLRESYKVGEQRHLQS